MFTVRYEWTTRHDPPQDAARHDTPKKIIKGVGAEDLGWAERDRKMGEMEGKGKIGKRLDSERKEI